MSTQEPFDEALNRLDGQLQLFPFHHRNGHRAYIARSNQASQLLDLELQAMAVLDDACTKWAAGKELPDLREADLHLLYARFEQALVCAKWLHGKAAFPQKTTAEILAFFLIDHWRVYGRAVWGAQMNDFVRR